MRPGAVIGEVPQQVGGRGDPAALLRDQGGAVATHGSVMNSPGWRSSWLSTACTDTDMAGITAPAWVHKCGELVAAAERAYLDG
ncbi:MAG: hypothetical protein ACR2MP_32550 [Streptosporangiaceae bacterium]